MKTFLKVRTAVFMALFCLVFTVTASAGNDLKGIWKFKSNDKNPKIIRYKILDAKNNYINFRSFDGGKTYQSRYEGTYEILIPGVYVERIGGRSISVTITYERNKDDLKLAFKLGETLYTEVWEKVKKSEFRK